LVEAKSLPGKSATIALYVAPGQRAEA